MVSEVPGIIDAYAMITPNPDGTVSFSVLIGLGYGEGGGKAAGSDLIELIISAEHVYRALDPGGQAPGGEAPAFPCHVGFSRHQGRREHPAA